MKARLKIGDKRSFVHKVCKQDIATFESGNVHQVCSTFALAKYIEWTSRIFVIDIKNEDEEGIGTMIHIDHISPAFIDQEVNFEATVGSIESNELICKVIVSTTDRLIASAKTGQKLLKKNKIKEIFSSLGNHI
jgi:fluoroacetyl-CoA thioesterase